MEIKVTIGLDEKVTKILNNLVEVLSQKQIKTPIEKEATAEITPQTEVAPEEVPTPTVVPVSAPSYNLADLQKTAGELVNLGKSSELQEALKEFGVLALTQLPEEKYEEFVLKLRNLGGNI